MHAWRTIESDMQLTYTVEPFRRRGRRPVNPCTLPIVAARLAWRLGVRGIVHGAFVQLEYTGWA
jgi:hypothetical protein